MTDILSEEDIAAGGQPSNQKVWFVRDEADSRKLSYYTCFNSVGQAQVKLFYDGPDSTGVNITHELTAAQDFADTITYVDAWVKGTSFDWTLPPEVIQPPVLALASHVAADPAAGGITEMDVANTLASGAIVTADANAQLAAEPTSLSLGAPLQEAPALGSQTDLQVLSLSALDPQTSPALTSGTVYWLADDGAMHPLTEEQVNTLSAQAGSLTLVSPLAPPLSGRGGRWSTCIQWAH